MLDKVKDCPSLNRDSAVFELLLYNLWLIRIHCQSGLYQRSGERL